MALNLCQCHSQPLPWCPTPPGTSITDILTMQHPAQGTGTLPGIGPDGTPHRGTGYQDGSYECAADCEGWHDGVVISAPHEGECAVCGEPYVEGEQVAKMPLPVYGHPYAHCICPGPDF